MNEWLNAEAHAARALDMYERGRWAEAEIELRKALALNPDHPEWQFNLGLTLEAAGRDADAYDCYQRAAELMPDEVDPLIMLGIVTNRLGNYRQAIPWFTRALELEPACELAHAHYMESLIRLGDLDAAELQFYLAQQVLRETSGHCLAMMGEIQLERGEPRKAGWCFREAIRIEPTIPRLRGRLGAVYAALGEPQKAVQMFLRELRDDPGNIDALLDYGELLAELGRTSESAEKFRRVLELEPANVDAHFQLGELAMQTRRYEQAHVEFELVLKLDPTYPHIRLALAETLVERGRNGDAEKVLADAFDDLAADDDARPRELGWLGDLLIRIGRPEDAAKLLERAVRLTPNPDADLWRKLALARYRSGDRDGGAAASRRVLRLDRRCVASMHNLALAAIENGNLRLAAGWIRRGLRRVDRHDDGLRRLRMKLWWARVGRFLRVGR